IFDSNSTRSSLIQTYVITVPVYVPCQDKKPPVQEPRCTFFRSHSQLSRTGMTTVRRSTYARRTHRRTGGFLSWHGTYMASSYRVLRRTSILGPRHCCNASSCSALTLSTPRDGR